VRNHAIPQLPGKNQESSCDASLRQKSTTINHPSQVLHLLSEKNSPPWFIVISSMNGATLGGFFRIPHFWTNPSTISTTRSVSANHAVRRGLHSNPKVLPSGYLT
jgi:hypothetical protein